MATKKKPYSRNRSSGRKKKSTSGGKNTASSFSWENEVLLFVVIAFAVVLFITNIGRGGVAGNVISRFFFGIFGVMSYAFPFALVLLVAFLISNQTTGRRGRPSYSGRTILKTFAGILIFLFLCVFAHMIYSGGAFPDFFQVFSESTAARAGGGLVGAGIAAGLIRAFGVIAAYVIDIAVLVLCVVLITERSPFRRLSEGGGFAQGTEKKRSSAEKKRGRGKTEKRSGNAKRDTRHRAGAFFRMGRKAGRGAKTTDGTGEAADESELSGDSRGGQMEPEIHMPGQDAASGEVPVGDGMEDEPHPGGGARKKRQSASEVTSEVSDINRSIRAGEGEEEMPYIYPDMSLLRRGDSSGKGDSRQHLQEMSTKLQQTLETFGVKARVTDVVCGSAVTQYEIHPEMGVKVSKILNLADDIKLNLMVSDIRIEAPIPGKAAIGIEVPNRENVTVSFRDMIESPEFKSHRSKIAFCAGKDIAGNVIMADIAKTPHLLIAGATGSGKSVCINTIIMSILYRAGPGEVKLIMIDPKVVELSVYNNIPHLLIPVVTDPKKAAGALHWAVAEMTERYRLFAEHGVRDIESYNKKIKAEQHVRGADKLQRMPQIVVIVDELADLMMVAPGDVEDAICRLAQLARAAGIHLIIATQRPSVNVITGLIKANMPSRIAFSVTSGVDSRTILDMNGAEKLLGKGDMLFYPQGFARPLRVQGAFVSDAEVSDVVKYIIDKNGQVSYNSDVEEEVKNSESSIGGDVSSSGEGRDVYFEEAARFLIEKEKGSIGMLQRNFKIGFNRAARIMDQLEEAGIVGSEEGTKPRRVLMTIEAFESRNGEKKMEGDKKS